jgi:hypothetical protein
MNTTAAVVEPADDVKVDDQLRSAVRHVMGASIVTQNDLARVQELLDRKAALARAPFQEKVRKIKESA